MAQMWMPLTAVLVTQCLGAPVDPTVNGEAAPRVTATLFDGQPSTLDGAALYATHCAVCHGADATGSSFAPALDQTLLGAAEIVEVIQGGGLVMPPIALGTAEAGAIAAWLLSSEPPAPPATDGAAIYAQNCAGCHGTNAEGTALAPFIQDRATENPNDLYEVIDRGEGQMPALRITGETADLLVDWFIAEFQDWVEPEDD